MEYKIITKEGLENWVKIIKYRPDGKNAEAKVNKRNVTENLLQIVLDDDSRKFVEHIEQVIAEYGNGKSYEGGVYLPTLNVDYKAVDMNKMPNEKIIALYEQLQELPIDIASSPYFWGALTLQEMKLEKIKPQSLLHILSHSENNKNYTKLLNIINSKITDENEMFNISESLARRVIRSLCGPGLFRGLPELIADCSLAKAWWCGKFAWEAQQEITNSDLKQIIEVLNIQWGTFADNLSGRLTVLREKNIIAGIIMWLLDYGDKSITSETVKNITKKLGQLASYQFLCLDEPIAIKKAIDEIMPKQTSTKI